MTATKLPTRGLASEALLSLAGIAAIALVTWIGVRLQANPATAALLYLGLVVLVSLRGSLVPALLVAIGGIACLDYFFTPPLFTITIRETLDIVALVTFSVTAVVITQLITALRRSERRWREVFENNPTMYFIVDAAGTVLSVNPFGAEQLGYTVDELVGQSVRKVFLGEDRDTASGHLARSLEHPGESMSWEIRKIRKDGTMLWVRETARAVQMPKEPPIVLIACEDFTERKLTRDKLRESEAHLREQASLLDLTHDTIFVRDLNDVIIYWNRGAEEQYGWTKAEAIGQVSHEIMRTAFPEPIDQINATLQRTGRWEGELVHSRRDGSRLTVASRWSVQRDERGQPVGTLESNNDITERRRAEESARQAEAKLARVVRQTTMGEFAASIAHELRQPLAAIAMNGSAALRWLNRETPQLDEARDAASRVVREATRADEIIKGLRILVGKSELQRSALDVKEVVDEVLELSRGELRRHEISVQNLVPFALPPAFGDRIQLQQVLINLILNAMEAMARSGDRPRVLTLRAEIAEPTGVGVVVEDSGPGLDRATADRIFDPFFTTKSSGLGMGLSICRSIIEAHGGELSVSSRSPHGTIARFTLPVAVNASGPALALTAERTPEPA